MEEVENWESLIKDKMRPCASICKIDDARKRNSDNATKRWRKKNWDHYLSKQKEWRDANPEKIKVYNQSNKKNTKRWAEEHPDRIRELGRKTDAKRAKSPKRIAWRKKYNARPEVKAKRREYDKKRNRSPERKAYEKERSRKRREEKKMKKEAALAGRNL